MSSLFSEYLLLAFGFCYRPKHVRIHGPFASLFDAELRCYSIKYVSPKWSIDVILEFQVWKLWTEDNVAASIDPRLLNSGYGAEIIRCIHIGLLCVQELPRDRPSVSAVLSMLSSEIADLPNPKQSAFTMRPTHSDVGTSSSQKSSYSLNNVTITMIDGR